MTQISTTNTRQKSEKIVKINKIVQGTVDEIAGYCHGALCESTKHDLFCRGVVIGIHHLDGLIW